MSQTVSRRMVLLSGLAGLGLAPLPVSAAALPYRLRPQDAEIGFTFTVGDVPFTGRAPLRSADITVNTADLARSTARVSANVKQARTGLIIATEALKSADVMDVARFPSAEFRSTRIDLGAAGRISEGATLSGDLTLRGVTRPVRLAATLSRPAGAASDDLSRLTIQLSGALNRKDFGINGYPDLVDDTVRLNIRAGLQAA